MDDKLIPWSNKITNIQANVLEALAKYKFLTLSQMLQIGVGTTQYKYLWKQVASLRDRKRGLVDRRNFNTEDRLGRVEDMYFLTKHGASALILDLRFPEEEIRLPKGKTIANKDYYHRKFTLDFQIKTYQWAEGAGRFVPYFHTYFDKTGNNRTDKNLMTMTRIDFEGEDYIIPDAAFLLSSLEKERLFLFEMHNGSDTFRLLKQLHKHAFALVRKFTHKKFKYPNDKSYTTLLLFEREGTKKAFIQRLIKEGQAFTEVQNYFLCKSLEDLEIKPFDTGWLTIYGKKGELMC